MDDEYGPRRGLLWFLFCGPGALAMWFERMNPASVTRAIASHERRDNVAFQFIVTMVLYVAAAFVFLFFSTNQSADRPSTPLAAVSETSPTSEQSYYNAAFELEVVPGDGSGVRVTRVGGSGFALPLGLRVGDVILSVQNETITSSADLDEVLSRYSGQDRLTATVLRDGETTDLESMPAPTETSAVVTPDNSAAATVSAASPVAGNWRGSYECGSREIGMLLQMQETQGQVSATFQFYPADGQSNLNGSFTMTGAYDPASRKFELQPGQWVASDGEYSMFPVSGRIARDGSSITGRIEFSGCGRFRAQHE